MRQRDYVSGFNKVAKREDFDSSDYGPISNEVHCQLSMRPPTNVPTEPITDGVNTLLDLIMKLTSLLMGMAILGGPVSISVVY